MAGFDLSKFDQTRESEMDRAPVSVEHRLVHHLAERRMRENRVHQIFFRRLKRAANDITLDHLSHLGAHHMRAQKLSGLLVKDGLYDALWLSQSDGFAVPDEGEAPDFDLIARLFRLFFCEPTLATCGWQ